MKKVKDFVINNWLTFYTLYLLTVITDSSTFFMRYSIIDDISKYVRYIAYVYFIARILFSIKDYYNLIKNNKEKLSGLAIFVMIVMGIFLVVNFILTKNKRMISIMILLLSAINVDYKKIFKLTMETQIVCTAFIVLSSVIGLNYNYAVGRIDAVYYSLRYSLGFTFPSDLSQIVMFSTLLYFYNAKENVRLREIVLIEIIVAMVYQFTNTKTDFLLSQLLIIIMLMFKVFDRFKVGEYKKVVKRVYSFIYTAVYPLLPIYYLILVFIYRFHSKLIKVNSILSNRLSQTYFNFLINKVKPFGTDITFYGLSIREQLEKINLSKLYIDNEYIQMMFKEGYIVAILFILLLTLTLIMLYRLKKYDEIIIASVFLTFGLINARILTFMYCPILFIIIPTIIGYNKNIKKVVDKNG